VREQVHDRSELLVRGGSQGAQVLEEPVEDLVESYRVLAVALCRLTVDGARCQENVLPLDLRTVLVGWNVSMHYGLSYWRRRCQGLRHVELGEGALRGRSVHVFRGPPSMQLLLSARV